MQAVLDDLKFPGTDDAIRARFEAELAEVGSEALHGRLPELDPGRRDRDPAVQRPPHRARAGGHRADGASRSPRTCPKPGPARYDTVQIGVDREVSELDARVDLRVDVMFEDGLVDEVRALVRLGLRDGRTASRALGYQQVLAAMDGACTIDFAAEETERATRRFVRRQRSWFRRDQRITWLDGARPDLVGGRR